VCCSARLLYHLPIYFMYSLDDSSGRSLPSGTSNCTPYRSFRHKKRYPRRRSDRWRNPCFIFLISFLALGSLRFRVPARSRKAASQLISKQREKRAAKRQQKLMRTNSTSTTVTYSLLEKGKAHGRQNFQKYRVAQYEKPLTVQHWAELMSQAADAHDPVIAGLLEVIRSAPFDATYFETPPVTSLTASSQPFEFVLMDAPELHLAASENPDFNAFAQKFSQGNDEYAVSFANLHGDALLIAPKPANKRSHNTYAHLSHFCRKAADPQITAVWRLAAKEYLQRIASQKHQSQPVWFSTSGMGIYWLHFRLDSVPKYYTYQPYKRTTQ